jgi:hypothetical protein
MEMQKAALVRLFIQAGLLTGRKPAWTGRRIQFQAQRDSVIALGAIRLPLADRSTIDGVPHFLKLLLRDLSAGITCFQDFERSLTGWSRPRLKELRAPAEGVSDDANNEDER